MLVEMDAADVLNATVARASIAGTWRDVIDDARGGGITLHAGYLSRLHRDLALPLRARSPGQFCDGQAPQDWGSFELALADLTVDGFEGCEAWILAQLCWGGHVQSMRFSTAWICLNGLRLQNGLFALYPDPAHRAHLQASLAAAGPDSWDAESLRALFGTYAAEQVPRMPNDPGRS